MDESQIHALAYMHIIQNEDTERETVPIEERAQILNITHKMGHIGTNAMVAAIHDEGKTWPKLAESCLDFIKNAESVNE